MTAELEPGRPGHHAQSCVVMRENGTGQEQRLLRKLVVESALFFSRRNEGVIEMLVTMEGHLIALKDVVVGLDLQEHAAIMVSV